MELAKKPVLFLCNADAVTFRISVPKTEHPYLFYKGQPYLVKYVLDIEFFDEHLFFDRVDESEQPVSPAESAEEIVEGSEEHPDESDLVQNDELDLVQDGEPKAEERQPYSKEELEKMRKSEVRKILKELAPEKTVPVKKENIVSAVLEAQEPSE